VILCGVSKRMGKSLKKFVSESTRIEKDQPTRTVMESDQIYFVNLSTFLWM